jgi:hypothetical protein
MIKRGDKISWGGKAHAYPIASKDDAYRIASQIRMLWHINARVEEI